MKEVSEKHRPFFATQHYYNRLRIANHTGMPSPLFYWLRTPIKRRNKLYPLLMFGGKTVAPLKNC